MPTPIDVRLLDIATNSDFDALIDRTKDIRDMINEMPINSQFYFDVDGRINFNLRNCYNPTNTVALHNHLLGNRVLARRFTSLVFDCFIMIKALNDDEMIRSRFIEESSKVTEHTQVNNLVDVFAAVAGFYSPDRIEDEQDALPIAQLVRDIQSIMQTFIDMHDFFHKPELAKDPIDVDYRESMIKADYSHVRPGIRVRTIDGVKLGNVAFADMIRWTIGILQDALTCGSPIVEGVMDMLIDELGVTADDTFNLVDYWLAQPGIQEICEAFPISHDVEIPESLETLVDHVEEQIRALYFKAIETPTEVPMVDMCLAAFRLFTEQANLTPAELNMFEYMMKVSDGDNTLKSAVMNVSALTEIPYEQACEQVLQRVSGVVSEAKREARKELKSTLRVVH